MQLHKLRRVTFSKPSGTDEHDEVTTQLDAAASGEMEAPPWVLNTLQRLADTTTYGKALSFATPVTVTPNQARGILNYTSDDIDSLDPAKLERVKGIMGSGKAVSPIVLGYQSQKWLLAGNTRLAYNSVVLGNPTEVVVIDVDKLASLN